MTSPLETVSVALSGNSYDILIADGLLSNCADILVTKARNNELLLVTDENVAQQVLPAFEAHLKTHNIHLKSYILAAGEGAKSWINLQSLCEWLIENGAERNDHIIALGGGVVGDITGFAAHIVKRGCNFIQIPTTLLSQVDSSVGGKTAINGASGKNLIGAFHQPSLVLIDPYILNSLPPRELAAGYAEVVKYGLIQDAEFFTWCSENSEIFFGDDSPERTQARIYAIKKSVSAKAAIVAADEQERSGTRALLNLGHTFGHALEAQTGFSEKLLHGEGVALGMVLAFQFSEHQKLCAVGNAEKISQTLAKAGLPVRLEDCALHCSGSDLTNHMKHDKKMSDGNLPFLLARGIGDTFLATDVALSDVTAFLDGLIT